MDSVDNVDRLAHFIAVFNLLGTKEAKERFVPITTGEESLGDTGLDSMDFLIISMYFCTWFGISDTTSKLLHPLRQGEEVSPQTGAVATGKDFLAFLEYHKTQELPSFEECEKDCG